MKLYTVKAFQRFQKLERLADADLCRMLDEMERGLVGAVLGRALVKRRVARAGSGKSGGYRVIVMYRTATRCVCLHGFAKSNKDNLSPIELQVYRDLASVFDAANDKEMAAFCAAGEAKEIDYEDDDPPAAL